MIRTAADFTPTRLRAALAERYDGFIVSIPGTDEALALLAASDAPTVVLDIDASVLATRTKNIVFIRNSPDEIGHAAADFLLSTGRCRSYAFVHNAALLTWSRDRYRAFREMLRDRGLWCHELADPSGLQVLPRPVGVFAANDDTGYETLEWCRAHKVRVPEDALVIGLNNDALICENCRPPLTSIQPDFESEGFLAAQTLALMMAPKHDGQRRTKISNCKFQIPDQPAHIPDQPAHIPDQPAHTPDQPAYIPDQPAHIPDQPAHTPDQPAHTPDQPAHIPDQPAHIQDQPARVQSEICNLESEIASATLFVGIKTIVRRDSTAEVSSAGKLVQKAIAFIRAHAHEGISARDVVRHLGCSRRLADLRFRELQGTSIGETLIVTRLAEVQRLLKSTRDPIDLIAADCGFENPNYLKNLFKRRFGMSMRDWRKLEQ